jgi:energy-coupling factor transporter ATP-binding protein EcfA2
LEKQNLKRLTSFEIAEAALLGDLALAMTMIGWLVTFFAVLQWLSAIPFGVLAFRLRRKAVIMSLLAVSSIGFLIGGITLVLQTYLAWVMGVSAAYSFKKGKNLLSTIFLSVSLGAVPTLTVAVGLLAIFVKARRIILNQTLSAWKGVGNAVLISSRIFKGLSHSFSNFSQSSSNSFLSKLFLSAHNFCAVVSSGLYKVGHGLSAPAQWAVDHWYLVFPASALVGILLLTAFVDSVSRPVFKRLFKEKDLEIPTKEIILSIANKSTEKFIGPVPVSIRNAYFKYPNSVNWALKDVSLDLTKGQYLVLAGLNGSGKSTLGWLLCGIKPTQGVVIRPGDAGLGEVNGTALIMQRPESQVLGARVIDDLNWGQHHSVQGSEILKKVGLEGFEYRETSGLSGGELQRLAIACALTKDPQLIVSDESTAMLDSEGRFAVIQSLQQASKAGATVVHITHIPEEIKNQNTLYLHNGEINHNQQLSKFFEFKNTKTLLSNYLPYENRKNLISVNNVSFVYSNKTPWQKIALKGVSLTVKESDALMIVGKNGSGKSTLAWLLAGLLIPTSGEVIWEPQTEAKSKFMYDNVGQVYVVFQHSRLQLVRDTVKANLLFNRRDATNQDIEFALELVGLDPLRFLSRSIRSLSGGELRRVALACGIIGGSNVIVLDEPLAGLDVKSQMRLIEALGSLKKAGKAIVVISHDFDQMESLIERVITLDNGQIISDLAINEVYAYG